MSPSQLMDIKSSDNEPNFLNGLRPLSSQGCCFECPYAFMALQLLHNHLSHHSLYCQMLRDGQMTSTACQQITSSVSSQKQGDAVEQRSDCQRRLTHQSTDHGEKSFILERCDETNQRIHTGEKHNTRHCDCKDCNKSFGCLRDLETHRRTAHATGDDKLFHCQQCDKSFGSAAVLKRHGRIHTGEKPFACERCDKSFRNPSNLKSHERLHTGERPFKCPHCDKSFRDSSNLIRHKRIHTGEKPFVCKQCGKSFCQIGDLKTHLRVHTGEKAFHCKQCDRSFSQRGSLKTHLRLHCLE